MSGLITIVDSASSTATGQGGQSIITGVPTPGSFVSWPVTNNNNYTAALSGTWTGTLSFEGSPDSGVTWLPVDVRVIGVNSVIQSATANGVFSGNSAGFTHLRVRATATVTGSAAINIEANRNLDFLHSTITGGTNNIGSVGQQKTVSVTPTVTAGAYTTGQTVGGIITLASILRTAGGSGYLPFIQVRTTLTTYTGSFDVFLFSKLPTGTYTDNATFNLTSGDAANLIGVRHLQDLTASGTGPVILRDTWLGQPVFNNDTSPGTNLYAIIVMRGSGTLGSTSAIAITATVDQN